MHDEANLRDDGGTAGDAAADDEAIPPGPDLADQLGALVARGARPSEEVLGRFREAIRRVARLATALETSGMLSAEGAHRLTVAYEAAYRDLEALAAAHRPRRPLRCDGTVVAFPPTNRAIVVVHDSRCLDISRPVLPPRPPPAPPPADVPF